MGDDPRGAFLSRRDRSDIERSVEHGAVRTRRLGGSTLIATEDILRERGDEAAGASLRVAPGGRVVGRLSIDGSGRGIGQVRISCLLRRETAIAGMAVASADLSGRRDGRLLGVGSVRRVVTGRGDMHRRRRIVSGRGSSSAQVTARRARGLPIPN